MKAFARIRGDWPLSIGSVITSPPQGRRQGVVQARLAFWRGRGLHESTVMRGMVVSFRMPKVDRIESGRPPKGLSRERCTLAARRQHCEGIDNATRVQSTQCSTGRGRRVTYIFYNRAYAGIIGPGRDLNDRIQGGRPPGYFACKHPRLQGKACELVDTHGFRCNCSPMSYSR